MEHYVPDWLLAIVGIATSVTAIAALSRKPPLSWVGHWIGFVFSRLIGEPVAAWLDKHFREEVIPLVQEQVAPIREDLVHLHDCVENVKEKVEVVDGKVNQILENQ